MADEQLDVLKAARSCVANMEGFERNSEINARLIRGGVNGTVYSNSATGMSVLVASQVGGFGGKQEVFIKAMKTSELETSNSFVFNKSDIAIRQAREERAGAPFNNIYVTPQTTLAELEKKINYSLGAAVQVAQKKTEGGQKVTG